VTNQAVQINQGGYSRQSFGDGHYCSSSTLVVSPFYLGNEMEPRWTRGQNYGIQASFSFPLDGGMTELCKSLAKRRLEKERLDFELVRMLKCAELIKTGFTIRVDSPYARICSDVVPLVREPKLEVSSPEVSEDGLPLVSEPAS